MAGANNKCAKKYGYTAKQLRTVRETQGVVSSLHALAGNVKPARPTKAFHAMIEEKGQPIRSRDFSRETIARMRSAPRGVAPAPSRAAAPLSPKTAELLSRVASKQAKANAIPREDGPVGAVRKQQAVEKKSPRTASASAAVERMRAIKARALSPANLAARMNSMRASAKRLSAESKRYGAESEGSYKSAEIMGRATARIEDRRRQKLSEKKMFEMFDRAERQDKTSERLSAESASKSKRAMRYVRALANRT